MLPINNDLIKLTIKIVLGFVVFGLYSCHLPKTVVFEEIVDTRDKKVLSQVKKTFRMEPMGVWVSNEFEGARLNSVTVKNDSTIVLKILPENQPINNSPYYAFKAWADTEKTIYFQLEYPKGFDNRYWPKIKKNRKWSIVDTVAIKLQDPVTVKLDLQTTPQILSAQEVNSSSDVRSWFMDTLIGKSRNIRLKVPENLFLAGIFRYLTFIGARIQIRFAGL